MKHKDLVFGMACGLAIGAVAGAVAALLLAPASGTDIRRKLRFERDHTVETARSKARRAMAQFRRVRPEEEDEQEEEGAFSGA
jgi:gas vesicle protein